VISICIENGPRLSIDSPKLWLGPSGASAFTYMNVLNNVVFAYNNQFNAPQIISELDPQDMRQVTDMATMSTAMASIRVDRQKRLVRQANLASRASAD